MEAWHSITPREFTDSFTDYTVVKSLVSPDGEGGQWLHIWLQHKDPLMMDVRVCVRTDDTLYVVVETDEN